MGKLPDSKPTKKKVEAVEPEKETQQEQEPDFMGMLNSPLAQSLLGGCKDLFKKEKTDPNVCEITIKAPSEVVLKLFKVSEEK